jgi:phage tail-like protein
MAVHFKGLALTALLPALGLAMPLRAQRTVGATNPPSPISNRFSVEIEGVLIAGVHSIDGLESESDVVEYKDGEDGTAHTRPGRAKRGKLTFTKDWTNGDWPRFSAWQKARTRKNGAIIFHNDAGEESGRFEFTDGLCTGWKLIIDARQPVALEVIEVTFTALTLK